MKNSGKLRVGFAGTPGFAIPALNALCEHVSGELVAVYTQPDRPAGRGRQVSMSPVKKLALANEIAIFQPENFASEKTLADFRALALDVLVVAAYGLILPQTILDSVRYPINIHASLLPRWRGAAPIQRAIMAGDEQTGVTIIRIVKQLDAGPMWLKVKCPIAANDTAESLHDKLAALGAKAITDALDMIERDEIDETTQDGNEVTYAEKLSADDRDLDWQQTSKYLSLQVRGLNPSPVATTILAKQQCKIWEATAESQTVQGLPGEIIFTREDGIGIQTKDGLLKLTTIQPPGKKPMSASDFLNGYGDRLHVVGQLST